VLTAGVTEMLRVRITEVEPAGLTAIVLPGVRELLAGGE